LKQIKVGLNELYDSTNTFTVITGYSNEEPELVKHVSDSL